MHTPFAREGKAVCYSWVLGMWGAGEEWAGLQGLSVLGWILGSLKVRSISSRVTKRWAGLEWWSPTSGSRGGVSEVKS